MRREFKDVHVYFPPKVLAELKKLAAQNRRSVTAEVVIAVEERIREAKTNGTRKREK
jgi:mRNA-degrading endonuclease RelE of RelBE toxin-antitoxin system